MPSALLALLAGCGADAALTCDSEVPHAAPTGSRENVLILLLDDVGLDKVGAYGLHPDPPRTPTLDALAASGVRFDRAYAAPSCSPTRASLLTGRHPARHGIGRWMDPRNEDYSLPDREVTFAEVVRTVGYSTGLAGKWHLSAFDGSGPQHHPQAQGFDRFLGILGNPGNATAGDGLPRGYYHWERVEDGVLSYDDRYLTTAQVDDALQLASTLEEPWVLYVALSAPHSPWDLPPADLAEARGSDPADRYAAVLEALDGELGRLLDGLGDALGRTTILTLGDNGTPEEVVTAPWARSQSKGTLTEGGVRVPLVVTGPQVARPGSVSEALVHVVDVFATVLDVAGVDPRRADLPVVDGRSLLPEVRDPGRGERRCLMVEQFWPNGRVTVGEPGARAVLDRDRKVVREDGLDESFSVSRDPSAEAPADRAVELARELDRYRRALR